jgi:colicin import membrane protein
VKAPAEAHERARQPGRIRSIILAVAVHAAFFALIVFGVSWQSRPTPPLQAELWDKLPPGRTAVAPKAEPEPAKAESAPVPPKAEPKAEPPKPAPPRADPKPEPPRPDPAIAERKEREKKEREKKEREKKELERNEQEKKDRAAKAAAEAKAAADATAKAAAKAAAEAKAKAQADAQAKAAAEAATQARASEIDRYRGRIRDKIRGKANVPDTVQGRPEVQVRITILPGGEVLDIVVVRSSGNRVYDTAIERAIRSAQPLPVPSDPELFGQFRSLTLNIQHER